MGQVLRDKQGRKIGEIKDVSGKQIIYDAQGRKLGSFDPKTNTTHDSQGRKVGTGNLLTSLLGSG